MGPYTQLISYTDLYVGSYLSTCINCMHSLYILQIRKQWISLVYATTLVSAAELKLSFNLDIFYRPIYNLTNNSLSSTSRNRQCDMHACFLQLATAVELSARRVKKFLQDDKG